MTTKLITRLEKNREAGKGANLTAAEVQAFLSAFEGNKQAADRRHRNWLEEKEKSETPDPSKVLCPSCETWQKPWDDDFYACPDCLPREEMQGKAPGANGWTEVPDYPYIYPGRGLTPAGFPSRVGEWEAEFVERKREEILKEVGENLRPVIETPGTEWFKMTHEPEDRIEVNVETVIEAGVDLDGGIMRVCGMDPTQRKGGSK